MTGRPAPPLWIADQVRNDGADGWNDAWCALPCGYCLKASMTAGVMVSEFLDSSLCSE